MVWRSVWSPNFFFRKPFAAKAVLCTLKVSKNFQMLSSFTRNSNFLIISTSSDLAKTKQPWCLNFTVIWYEPSLTALCCWRNNWKLSSSLHSWVFKALWNCVWHFRSNIYWNQSCRWRIAEKYTFEKWLNEN